MLTGPGDVLALIRRGQVRTRRDVLDHTGLSRMTVRQRVDTLLAAGLIVESPTPAGSPRTGEGRRPRSLQFNREHGHVVAASVDTTHVRIAITDLGGRVVADRRFELAVTQGPTVCLDAIAEVSRELLDAAAVPIKGVCAIGVSVPGPIDPQTGRPSQPPIMPGWDNFPIAEHIQSTFPGLPVLAANDADAAALGEQSAYLPDDRAVCMVKVSTGIGSGLVVDGQIYRGVDGGAGDIGHIRLAGHEDAVCQCGAHGCLAAVASGRAVARALTQLGVPAESGHDVGALLAAGNPHAARLAQEAGRLIGEVMATVVCVMNPGAVVLGGDLASPALLAGVRETLYRFALPRATRHLNLQLSRLGEDAPIVGLTRFVVDTIYAAEQVNRRLGS